MLVIRFEFLTYLSVLEAMLISKEDNLVESICGKPKLRFSISYKALMVKLNVA